MTIRYAGTHNAQFKGWGNPPFFSKVGRTRSHTLNQAKESISFKIKHSYNAMIVNSEPEKTYKMDHSPSSSEYTVNTLQTLEE
jgi:hypothetical protein